MTEDQILDHPMDEEEKRKDVLRKLAGGGKRLGNMVIDGIAIYILYAVVSFTFITLGSNSGSLAVVFVFIILFLPFLYYWIMEATIGKTVGKFVTRTRIVKEDGSKPEGINVLGRTLSRLIPFDAFSFLGAPGEGWHDSIPKIYVINED